MDKHINVNTNSESCFLDNIDDKNIVWRITSVNGDVADVKVVNYRVTTNGTPITLTLFDIYKEKTFEVPWHAIMTIEKNDL